MLLGLLPKRFRSIQCSWCLLPLLLSGSFVVQGQVGQLFYRPVDAAYSKSLNRIIAVSGQPDQLHVYDPIAQVDYAVALAGPPLSLAISPDGTHAAVAHAKFISYVNLQTRSVEKTFQNFTATSSNIILTSDSIYAPISIGADSASALSIASGQVTLTHINAWNAAAFDASLSTLYATTNYDRGLVDYNVTGTATASNAAGKVVPACGPLVVAQDGTRVYSGCGQVYTASQTSAADLDYLGQLDGVSNVQSLAESQSSRRIAVVKQTSWYSGSYNDDTSVYLLNRDTWITEGQLASTPFVVAGTAYPAHVKHVWFDATASSLLMMTQADSSASLLQDFAVERVDLTKPNSCAAKFGTASVSASAAGSYVSVPILSGEGCLFTAVSNAAWITVASGGLGSGDTSLQLLVRPYTGEVSRDGNVTLGDETLTVVQSGTPNSPPGVTALSFKPVAAGYDKALDRVVMVAALPNELHIYNPVDHNDQIVPLHFPPTSVFVRPDGLFASIGHNGHLTVVDLKKGTITQEIPVPIKAGSIVAASNGYTYIFPDDSDYYCTVLSLELASSQFTPLSSYCSGSFPQLDPTGSYIYLTGSQSYKLDIRSGPAAMVPEQQQIFGKAWIDENGQRLLSQTGSAYLTSDVPSLDLTFNGQLDAANSVAWAAESRVRSETAVLTDIIAGQNTQLQIYSDTGLQLVQQSEVPGFSAGGKSYNSHGRYVFWNSDASKLFAITQADDSSGLSSPFAIYDVESLSGVPTCTYSVSPSELWVANTTSFWTFGATSNCSYKPQADDSWLYVGDFGFQKGINGESLTVTSSSDGLARTGKVHVGTSTLLVHQEAASCNYSIFPTSVTYTQAGGSGSISLKTGTGCHWSIQNNASWVEVIDNLQAGIFMRLPGEVSSGVGPVTIQYAVLGNNTAATSLFTSLLIAGLPFNITQTTVPISPPLNFLPVTPCRVADTRLTNGPFGGPFVAGGSVRTFNLSQSACSLPPNAAAYSLNITVVPHGPLGYLTAWPGGQPQPFVSTLNSADGRVKANSAILGAGPSGAVSIYATNDTDVVLDVNGVFIDAQAGKGLEFYPIEPCRVGDTRLAPGPFGGPSLMGGNVREMAMSQSACNLDSSAGAYSLNYTAVPKNGNPLGYLATWPSGEEKPFVSTLNAMTGKVTANAAVVPAGSDGGVDVFATQPSDLVIDANGYFAAPGSGGLHFYAMPPCRYLDTRLSGPNEFLNGQYSLYIAGSCEVSQQATAVVVNSTVIPIKTLGHLTLWPLGQPQPFVSTLNSPDGAVTSNMAIVPLQKGAMDVFTTDPTHLILDVTGYFAP